MAGQMVAGGIFNAVAFAGAGFLFSKLNHSGYSEEMHRHNIAMEKLSQAREKFYEEEVQRKNKMDELRREIETADRDLSTTNEYLRQYKKLKSAQTREPQLSDYYKPSTEMQHYENIVKSGMAIGSGALLFYFCYRKYKKFDICKKDIKLDIINGKDQRRKQH